MKVSFGFYHTKLEGAHSRLLDSFKVKVTGAASGPHGGRELRWLMKIIWEDLAEPHFLEEFRPWSLPHDAHTSCMACTCLNLGARKCSKNQVAICHLITFLTLG